MQVENYFNISHELEKQTPWPTVMITEAKMAYFKVLEALSHESMRFEVSFQSLAVQLKPKTH